MQGFLTFRFGDQAHMLALPKTAFTFGRNEALDLTINAQGVPDHCGALTWDPSAGTWNLEATGSAMSSLRLDGKTVRQTRSPLYDGVLIDLAGATLRFDRVPELPIFKGKPVREIPLSNAPLRLGTAPGDDGIATAILDSEDPEISRFHALLEFVPGEGVYLSDKSQRGTLLNGQLFQRQRLIIGDRFLIGAYSFEYTGRTLRRLPPSIGGRLQASGLCRTAGGRAILSGVSLDVPAGSFLGILGGSGQGKSTLLTALCGLVPASAGEVLVDGRRMFQDSGDSGAGVIGFVPQDDIVHSELTVEQAITCSARLRLGGNPPASEIRALVHAIAKRLGLEPHMHKRITQLSGGQRKRVSIATELLAKPSVLFLDEPSSGLDPATEFNLMKLLREFAGSDCTVLCTTHVLGRAWLFDRILFVQGGRVVFDGRPNDALEFFGKTTLDDIYLELDNPAKPAQEREAEFHASGLQAIPAASIPIVHDQGLSGPPPRPSWFSTCMTLMKRQWLILKADKLNLWFLLLQAVAIASIIGWVAENSALRSFLTVVAVLWFGCSNAAQQIVGERAILNRERVCGLGVHAYIQSKLSFVFGVTVLQSLILFSVMTLIAHQVHPPDFDEEALREDARLTGAPAPGEATDAEPYDAGVSYMKRRFAFTDEAARKVAEPFQVKNKRGAMVVDDTTLVRRLEAIDRKLLPERDAGATPESLQEKLKAALSEPEEIIAPEPPPSEFYVNSVIRLAKFFELQDNILQSAAKPMKDLNGSNMKDKVTGRLMYHKALPVGRVITFAIFLKFLALASAAIVGCGIGLAISAAVRSPTQAVMWVPLVLIPQILFGGFVITLPEMNKTTRMVSHFMPSASAQRIFETSSIYGQSIPYISNRTKIPVFFNAKEQEITWTEEGEERTESYPKASPINTALQNLIVIPDFLGKRVVEKENVGTEEDPVNKPRDNVKSTRKDIAPYMQGMILTETRQAGIAAASLGAWLLVSYLLVYLNLRSTRPK